MSKFEIQQVDFDLPEMFMINKSGKEVTWRVYVIGNTVHKVHGQVEGKLQNAQRDVFGVGKGKTKTTDEEQAKRVAERDWISQIKKGYFPKCKKGIKLANKIVDAKKLQGNVNTGMSKLIRSGDKDSKDSKVDKDSKKSKSKKEVDDSEKSNLVKIEQKYETMQCQKWENVPKCLKYFNVQDGKFVDGAFIQPKLDGIRSLVYLDKESDDSQDSVIFVSRGKNQFPFLNHIRKDALAVLKKFKNVILDGEFYAHHVFGNVEYKGKSRKAIFTPSDEELPIDARFQVITGACKVARTSPHILENQMEYHVFDIADPTGKLTQEERFSILDKIFKYIEIKGITTIKRVETRLINKVSKIETIHDEFAEQGYEGIVLRAIDLKYEMNRRSNSIRKYKEFEDMEVDCVGVKKSKGVSDDQFVWLVSKDGQEFKAKPRGTTPQKLEWYANRKKYINKCKITIRFQKMSDAGIPRFPIGIAVRDYE